MSKSYAAFLAVVCLLIAPVSGGQTQSSRISITEAEELVKVAIHPKENGVNLEQINDPNKSDFIFLDANFSTSEREVHMGTFAVNPWTGDVWNTAGLCTRLTSPKLVEMLKSIRVHSRLTSEEFNKLRDKKPNCDAD